MARNPVQNATVPKAEKHERDIWDTQTLMKALFLSVLLYIENIS